MKEKAGTQNDFRFFLFLFLLQRKKWIIDKMLQTDTDAVGHTCSTAE